MLTGLFFGLAPAIQSTRPASGGDVERPGRRCVGGAGVGLRKALVMAQVALSLLLLVGAGLFLQSLNNLRALNPGFDTSDLVSFATSPMLNGYTQERGLQFYRQLMERMNRMPGVTSASLAVMALLDGNEWDSTVTVEGYTTKQGEWVDPHMQFVSPGYFATLKIPVMLGRDFTDRDDKGAPKVGS